MQYSGQHFDASESWTNPGATRAALKEVRNAHAGLCISDAFRGYLNGDENDEPAEDEEDAPGEYSDLPLAIPLSKRWKPLWLRRLMTSQKRTTPSFEYDLTPELAILTVAKRIEDLQSPHGNLHAMRKQHFTRNRRHRHHIDSENVSDRPTTRPATRAHVAFEGNRLTAELIGAMHPIMITTEIYSIRTVIVSPTSISPESIDCQPADLGSLHQRSKIVR